MYRGIDTLMGLGARIYRMPEEIKRDISELKNKIEEINSRLNIRALVLDFLSDGESSPPEKLVPALESMLAEAEEALTKLKVLREELSDLEEELYEVKCEIGI